MIGLLALLFLVVPIAELYVIIQVAHGIGAPNTILLLIAISILGAWLTKAAGMGVLNRLQRTVREGRVPSAELIDGGLVLFAGALMITPGFLSDCLAILLLLPPTRALARRALLRRIRSGGGVIRVVAGMGRPAPGADLHDEIWDVEGWEDPPTPPGRSGLTP
ncbi:MAG: FxsA family protein [Acidimicrobiales bacterium]